MSQVDVQRCDLPLLHIRGQNVLKVLGQLGCEELGVFQFKAFADNHFVAKLGKEELMLAPNNTMRMVLGGVEQDFYAFQRGDAVFELSGNWQGLMSEVCIYDFRQSRPGDFLMVLIAGVSVWMLIPQDGETLFLGCDPSYGHYLSLTLMRQVDESPFLNRECKDDY